MGLASQLVLQVMLLFEGAVAVINQGSSSVWNLASALVMMVPAHGSVLEFDLMHVLSLVFLVNHRPTALGVRLTMCQYSFVESNKILSISTRDKT